jgi:hypothetical protein
MRWTFWLYASTALPWAGALLAYGLRSPWWRSWTGRAMFWTFGSLTAVLTLASVLRFLPLPYWLAITLVAATLAGVQVAGWAQLINVLRLQRRDRDR